MKLLSNGNTNTKTAKSDKIQDKYLTAILYLAPSDTSGLINVCPLATDGCKQSCLFTAGRGAFSNVQAARVRKTTEFVKSRELFLATIRDDINRFIKKCNKLGKLPAVRLNGTSDLQWEHFKIIEEFPQVQFYDYTAIAKRLTNQPSNYYLTFSRKEDNDETCLKVLQTKTANVAMVFRKQVPKQYLGFKVIDGDKHDLRFLDERNVIVGLKAKGKAKKDKTGFVIDLPK